MQPSAFPIQAWLNTALGRLLPGRCPLCAAHTICVICERCSAFWPTDHSVDERCPVCAISLCGAPLISGRAARCGQCLAHRPAFDATLVLADYQFPLDALVLALKFEGRLGIATELGRRLAERWLANQAMPPRPHARAQHKILTGQRDTAPQLVVPIPLGAARLIERGYNQSWAIARAFARHARLPCSARLLERRRETAAQMRANASRRRANMHDAFAARGGPAFRRLRGAHVIVVDDVMTTGATLHAMAITLKQAGAARVSNVVALRTPLSHRY